mgnify:CR=1 FL=1
MGKWDETTLVICDFGTGGKNLRALGHIGTPGFGSPEQMLGRPSTKSDNYSYGIVMVYLFNNWSIAWDMLYEPLYEPLDEPAYFPPELVSKLLSIVRGLIKVGTYQLPFKFSKNFYFFFK